LTAAHCVVRRGPLGEFTRDLVAAKELTIELGGDYLPWGHVGVASIVSLTSAEDGKVCGERGGLGDLAVLVLPRKLVGLGIMPLREMPPAVGEVLEPIGFGRCAMSADAIRRKERQGGRVDWLTPEMTIKEIMGVFDRTGSDELAVLDEDRGVLGLVSEAYATRRYAEELEKNRRDLVGGE